MESYSLPRPRRCTDGRGLGASTNSSRHYVPANRDGSARVAAATSPTVMQFQKIILKQGASTGWHHHDGPAWVILENGSSVVETHCGGGSEHLQPGTAFIEPIGLIHLVENYGPGEATITWATTYPQGGSPIVEEADQSHPCPQ